MNDRVQLKPRGERNHNLSPSAQQKVEAATSVNLRESFTNA
jgi:hypothetical protein